MQEQLKAVHELLAHNEIKKAEIILARYLRSSLTDKQKRDALIYRARTRLRSARPDDAIDDLLTSQQLVTGTFDTPELLELLADCYLARFELASVGFADRNDTAKANEYFHQILERHPRYMNRGWIYYQLGRIALADNDVSQAEIYFQKALLTPSSVYALTAFCYERLGFIAFYETRQPDVALGFLDKAVYTYPATETPGWLVQVHILRSRVLRADQMYDLAIEAAQVAVDVAAGSPESVSNMAEAHLTLAELLSAFEGRQRDVVTHLHQLLQISKKPPGIDVTWSRVHEMLGDAYFKLMHYNEAAEAYEAALQYNPDHPWEISLHYRIARSYYQQNDYAATVTAVERLMATADAEGERVQDYRIFDVLGNAQFALGQYAAAACAYQNALEIAPPSAASIDKIKKYYQFAQELR